MHKNDRSSSCMFGLKAGLYAFVICYYLFSSECFG